MKAIISILILVSLITQVSAIGEASTSLYVFVSPTDKDATTSYLVVTATQDQTTVNIIDLDTTIGDPTSQTDAYPVVDVNDPDLSETVELNKGQSRAIKVSNHNYGPDSDGTYFHVDSDKPVIVLSTTNQGTWQADFVPSIDGTSKGREFFVYLPSQNPSFTKGYDLSVFAYDDNTTVIIRDVSVNPYDMNKEHNIDLNHTTEVNLKSNDIVASGVLGTTNPQLFMEASNNNGVYGGYTYHVIASKPVTVQSAGTIGHKTHEARDGGSFVPGVSNNPYLDGTGLASEFLVQMNLYGGDEAELSLVNQNTTHTANVSIYEYIDDHWYEIGESPLCVNPSDLVTLTGNGIFIDTGIVKVISKDLNGNAMDISVFAATWLETGGYTTSDVSSFATGSTGYGGSKETIFYVPPPASENFFGGVYSHIFVYAYFESTTVNVQAWDTNTNNWTTIQVYNNLSKHMIIDHRITQNQWQHSPGGINFHKMRVLSTERTTVQINNWNDNWACYVPGGTPPEFIANINIKTRYLIVPAYPNSKISYNFDIINRAFGDIGCNLYNLSVTNTLPDGIDQTVLEWTIISTILVTHEIIESNVTVIKKIPIITNLSSSSDNFTSVSITNGTKYTWTGNLTVNVYAYDDGTTKMVFDKNVIEMDETLTFNVKTTLNNNYVNGDKIKSCVMIIDLKAQAENPFIGRIYAKTKLLGTLVISELKKGYICLY